MAHLASIMQFKRAQREFPSLWEGLGEGLRRVFIFLL